MPQIWLTYSEFAALIDCAPDAARAAAVALRLDRRRSHDGLTRVKLTPSLSETFIEGIIRQRLDREIAACAADLYAMRARMASPTADSADRKLGATG